MTKERIVIIVGSVTAGFNREMLETLTAKDAKKHVLNIMSGGSNSKLPKFAFSVIDDVLKPLSFQKPQKLILQVPEDTNVDNQ